jgi:hypothetical protein
MRSSGSVPARQKSAERNLSALTDDDIAAFAARMALACRSVGRWRLLAMTVAIVILTSLMMLLLPTNYFYPAMAGVCLLATVPFALHKFYERSLALEIKGLGYNSDVTTAVNEVYGRLVLSIVPRLDLRKNTEACRHALRHLRSVGS